MQPDKNVHSIFPSKKKTHQKYHHSKRDDLSLTLIPTKKGVYPGRLTTGTTTITHEKKGTWWQKPNLQGQYVPAVNLSGCVCKCSSIHPLFSPSKLSPKTEAPNAWSGQKTTHIKPCGISTRSVHLNVCQQLKKGPAPTVDGSEIWRFQNKTSWGKGG